MTAIMIIECGTILCRFKMFAAMYRICLTCYDLFFGNNLLFDDGAVVKFRSDFASQACRVREASLERSDERLLEVSP